MAGLITNKWKFGAMRVNNSPPTPPLLPLTQYCVDGRFGEGDTIHGSGRVDYKDEHGELNFIDGIVIESGTVSFMASSIVSYFGIVFVDCDYPL